MILSLIVAASENNVIGKNNVLPWKLPDDLRHFREMTKGKPIIMGRKTFESIGRALPDRLNIVITRQEDYEREGVVRAESLDDAIDIAKESNAQETCVIGGGEIYKQAMEKADRIYLTQVHATLEGDTYFPEIDESVWAIASKEEHSKDDAHEYEFTFITYQRA